MDDESQKPDEVAGAKNAELRAAYLLGRNLHLMDGWLMSVADIAQHDDRPWDWEHPYTFFGDSFNAWPSSFYSELDDSLRTLVLGRVVDAAALVEFRHLLDLVSRDCAEVAELAEYNQRHEIGEMRWIVGADISNAIQFGERVIVGPKLLSSMWQLGDLIGKLLDELAHCLDYEPYLQWLNETVDLAEELFDPETEQVKRMRDLILSPDAPISLAEVWAKIRELMSCVKQLDDWIVTRLPLSLALEPYIVLDDQRRTLTFLGVDIRFDEVKAANASGGLELLRVLIQQPGKPLSAAELISASGDNITADSTRVVYYFSRLRKVLRAKEEFWPKAVRNSIEYSRAKSGFIVADRMARKHSPGNETWYKLDLPPYRVKYIPAG